MGTMALPLSIGDRAPGFLGAAASGRFFSLDAQAGRPALLVTLGALEPEAAAIILDRLRAAAPALAAAGVDAVAVAPATPAFTGRFAADPQAADQLVYATSGDGFESTHL